MPKQEVSLGDEVVDKVTGFKGIAVARTVWLNKCVRVIVQPPVDKDGKMPEAQSVDEEQIDIVKSAKVSIDKPARTGGGGRNDKLAGRRN